MVIYTNVKVLRRQVFAFSMFFKRNYVGLRFCFLSCCLNIIKRSQYFSCIGNEENGLIDYC